MKTALTIIFLLMMTGCASLKTALAVITSASDQSLDLSLMYICRKSRMEDFNRFFNTDKLKESHGIICERQALD